MMIDIRSPLHFSPEVVRNADYFFAFLTCIPNVPLLNIVELLHDSLLLLSFLLRWFTYSVDGGFLSVVALVSLNPDLI